MAPSFCVAGSASSSAEMRSYASSPELTSTSCIKQRPPPGPARLVYCPMRDMDFEPGGVHVMVECSKWKLPRGRPLRRVIRPSITKATYAPRSSESPSLDFLEALEWSDAIVHGGSVIEVRVDEAVCLGTPMAAK